MTDILKEIDEAITDEETIEEEGNLSLLGKILGKLADIEVAINSNNSDKQ